MPWSLNVQNHVSTELMLKRWHHQIHHPWFCFQPLKSWELLCYYRSNWMLFLRHLIRISSFHFEVILHFLPRGLKTLSLLFIIFNHPPEMAPNWSFFSVFPVISRPSLKYALRYSFLEVVLDNSSISAHKTYCSIQLHHFWDGTLRLIYNAFLCNLFFFSMGLDPFFVLACLRAGISNP